MTRGIAMRRTLSVIALIAFAGATPAPRAAAGPTVTVRNPLGMARTSETIALAAADVLKVVAVDDLRKVHVRDASGRELLVQALDVNDDGKVEELIFQTDIGPKETKRFELFAGERHVYKKEDFKTYGRFNRERRDDFAWENDRVAHRMYGAALETWAQEPLTSSAVDIWTKRVPRLVINDWYMVDDYHRDGDTGGDFYSAGRTRGCGGNGLWVGGKLYPSANFRDSRVYAQGPIRVMFDLVYQAWDAAGAKVSEVKRITLDAGHNFSRFESRYTFDGGPRETTHAVGIKNNAGSTTASSREQGTLRAWEPIKAAPGNIGCAVLVDPAQVVEFPQADNSYLVVAKIPAGSPAVYHAGFAWEATGQVPGGVAGWDKFVADTAAKLRAPLEVTIAP
jgi:hypothetical protein